MTTPQQIREWLRKMQYPNPNPSEKELEKLCRGPMGPIFQQIMDKVKPRQEIEQRRKAIRVNKLIKGQTIESSSSKDIWDGLEKPELYNEKCKLEKELEEIKAQNLENEANLENIKARIKVKYAKYQTLKEKRRESEKDIVLLRAKTDNLKKQLETGQKLYEQSNILERTNNEDADDVAYKVKDVVSKLCDITSSYNPQSSPSAPDLTAVSETSGAAALLTSDFLSSNKKPLSPDKRSKRANSTPEKLADITNIRATDSFAIDKNVEAVKDLEQICWNDQIIKLINDLQKSNCEEIFKSLCDLKEKQINKISEMISRADGRKKDYDMETITGLEKLYAVHVETELERISCQQQNSKIKKLIASMNLNDISTITKYKAKEIGLKNALEHARKCVVELQEKIPDNSDQLNRIFSKIENMQTKMVDLVSKIQTNFNILRGCGSWMDIHMKNISESIRKPHQYSEYDLFKYNYAEQDVQQFVSCPFQSQESHYFDSWAKIYRNPELLEIFKLPFLSPDYIIKLYFEQKNWLHQLQLCQKEAEDETLNKRLALVNVACDEYKMIRSYSKSVGQLKASASACTDILKQASELDTEMKLYWDAPLNDCVAPDTTYENKTLKEYCELYDSYYQ